MTREEAKKNLVAYMYYAFEDLPDDVGRAIDMAIRALEQQEFILDKIRAEIWDLQYGDEEKSMTDEDRADAYNNAITQVIDIIDKYKTESEEEG